MKKTIRKPENWQDFESLCKKLWGELWEIPYEIKKNGRLGQPQAGVDVYGVPKGEANYFGIQAKGKDDYTDAKLDIKEIENEIEKAKKFSPSLDVFIIATTANKDVKVEQYIREQDIISRNNSGFKILLFCWEDIADLIEENRETFNWYVNESSFRDKYDVEIFISDFNTKEFTINPKFENLTKFYKFGTESFNGNYASLFNIKPHSFFGTNKINHAWCKIEIIIQNTGSIVLEDWKLHLQLSDNINKIDDCSDVHWMLSDDTKRHIRESRTTYAYEEDKFIKYIPVKNSPLIQNDNTYFKFYIKPLPNPDPIIINWILLARDFKKEGVLMILNEPIIKNRMEIIWVDKPDGVQETSTEIIELITEGDN